MAITEEKRRAILQTGEVNVQNQTLFSLAVPRDYNHNRLTIMIGSGGSGIDAIIDAKKTADSTLKENYRNQVAYIGVDADEGKLSEAAAYGIATVNITQPGATDRISRYAYRDEYFKTWLPKDFSVNFDDHGSKQQRLVGKAKFYDNAGGSFVSSVFRGKIRDIIDGWSGYQNLPIEIIIAAGLSGGTGSGTFIDLAVNARMACQEKMRQKDTQIYGYLFLADTVEEFNQNVTDLNAVYANCYAALKEVESYQCLRQNPERKVKFKVRGDHTIEFDSVSPIFNRVVLISGGYRASKKMVAECLADLLAKIEGGIFGHDAFYSNAETYRNNKLMNAMNEGLIREGFFPEDSHSYCAIGMATASIPEEIVVANVISHVCEKLYQESALDVDDSAANLMVYFRKRDDVLNRTDAEKEVRTLYGWSTNVPLKEDLLWKKIDAKIVSSVQLGQNDIEITIDQINAGQTAQFVSGYNVTAKTNDAVDEVRQYLRELYLDFENKAASFMKKYGPRAFLSLYKGKGPVDENGAILDFHDISIEYMMEIAGNKIYDVSMKNVPMPELHLKKGVLGLGDKTKIADWKGRMKLFVQNGIRKEVCRRLRGNSGLWQEEYVARVEKFIEYVENFTANLEELIQSYHNAGMVLDRDQIGDFGSQMYQGINVNLCDDSEIFNWVKTEVAKAVSNVDIRELRTALVEDFMKNKQAWVSEVVGVTRERFDRIMSRSCKIGREAPVEEGTMDLSVRAYFNKKLEDVERDNMKPVIKNLVTPIVSQLLNKSRPALLAEGVIAVAANRFILIPNSLAQSANGKLIMEAIQETIKQQDARAELASSESVTKIVCYQTSVANALYDVKGIDRWEKAYDANISGCDLVHLCNGEKAGVYHEISYAAAKTEQEKHLFGENLSWRHYPALALHRKHRESADESAEKRFLETCFDPIFDYALENRIIERIGDMQNGFEYQMYIIPDSWSSMNLSGYHSMETGKKLFDYLAGLPQNRKGGETEYVKTIKLNDSGVYSLKFNPSDALASGISEEEILRRYDGYARAILRRNTGLFRQLRHTLCKFAEIKDVLAGAMEVQRIKEECQLFILCLLSGVILQKKDVWVVRTDYENYEPFLDCSMFSRLSFSEYWKKLYQDGLLLPLTFLAFRTSNMCCNERKRLSIVMEYYRDELGRNREKFDQLVETLKAVFGEGSALYQQKYGILSEEDRSFRLMKDYGCSEMDSVVIAHVYEQWMTAIQ